MGPECYVLRWDEFNTNFFTQLQNLRDCEELLDCSLYCDEGTLVPAHKVVLATYSPYFRNMLKKVKDQNPVIIMPPNVKFEDLVSLVDFMYNGETAIPRDNMEEFLAVAEQFKIRGLFNERPQRQHPQQMQFRRPPGRSQPPPRPQQVLPPDIRNRLPPGISMKSVGATPMKRPRLDHSIHEDVDDIEEIPGDEEEGADYYGGYDDEYESAWDGGQSSTSPINTAPQPTGRGPQLMGLICPHCRLMCQGVAALKEHISVCPRTQGQQSQQQQQQQQPQQQAHQQPQQYQNTPAAAAHHQEEGPYFCNICDKNFKSARTRDNHMKKQHELHSVHQGGPSPGRPIMKPSMGGRGRRIDNQPHMMDTSGDGWSAASSAGPEIGGPPPPPISVKDTPRPVGQVAPAQRSATPKSEHDQGPRIATSEERRPQPSVRGRGRGMGPGGMPRHVRPHPATSSSSGQHSGESRPDLLKLGQKFGGSISIGVIDSGNNKGGGKRGGDGQGVSIQKLKGDVPVGMPMNIREGGGSTSSSKPPSEAGSGGSANSGPVSAGAATSAVADDSGGQPGSVSGSGGDGASTVSGGGTTSKAMPGGGPVKEEPKDFSGDEDRGQDDEFEDYPEEEDFDGEDGVYQESGVYDGGLAGEEEEGGRPTKYQSYPEVGEEYDQE